MADVINRLATQPRTAAGRRIARLRNASQPVIGHWMLVWVGGVGEAPWLAVTVGRKLGKAHERNRLRRRLKEAARHLRLDRPLLVTVRSAASSASYRDLSHELERLVSASLARAGGDVTHLDLSGGDLPAGGSVVPV